MSRLAADVLDKALAETVEYATVTKPRKFTESVELQVGLRNYDPKKDPRFNVATVLPHLVKPNMKICIIADAADKDRAAALGVPTVDVDYLKTFNKDAKQIKKFAKKYDVFLASKSTIRLLPRVVGPGLSRANRTPIPLNPEEDLARKIHETKCSVKIAFKKAVGLNWGVGTVAMPREELASNINTTLNTLTSQLKKHWQNIKCIYIKSTMGKPHHVY